MISITGITYSDSSVVSGSGPLSLAGLSKDTKPTDKIGDRKIANGSTFIEMDTKKVFMFDAESKIWREL